MGYRVDYTEYGETSRDNAIEYLLYKVGDTGNPQAAINLMNEIDEALDILEKMPESFPVCEHKYLHAQGIRKIHLRHMAYKIFYQ